MTKYTNSRVYNMHIKVRNLESKLEENDILDTNKEIEKEEDDANEDAEEEEVEGSKKVEDDGDDEKEDEDGDRQPA